MTARDLYGLAVRHCHGGDLVSAERCCRAVLDQEPQSASALNLAGTIHRQSVCEVYQGQAPYAISNFSDEDFKPLFYVEWDNGGDYASGVRFYFFQGIGVTTVGTNCWQVDFDPYGQTKDDADWGQSLWCPPDDTSISFYPWNFDSGTDEYIDLLDFDSDDPTIYEIGVEANDGDPTDNITAWIGASFDT